MINDESCSLEVKHGEVFSNVLEAVQVAELRDRQRELLGTLSHVIEATWAAICDEPHSANTDDLGTILVMRMIKVDIVRRQKGQRIVKQSTTNLKHEKSALVNIL